MPGHRIYKDLGLHRQAGIALYRALLQQCRAVPLPEASQTTLQNVVRNRFWSHRNQAGARFIKLAFHAGYKALDMLDAASAGDAASTSKIAGYLERMPKPVTSAPKKHPAKSKPREHGSEAYEVPLAQKFLATFPRPANKIPRRFKDKDGIRKVPFLVNAQYFPFVRYKHEQPKNLSRVLRQKRDKYFERTNIMNSMTEYFHPIAAMEDAWDEILQSEFSDIEIKDDWTFRKTYQEVERHAYDLFLGMVNKRRALADQMRNIVLTERQLAEEEREAAIRKGKIKETFRQRDYPTSQW